MNPIWIVSLFIGISEVTAGAAATQCSGWCRAVFTVFSVLFPTAISAVFFATLWKRPHVLYAPGDFSEGGPGVREFVTAMTMTTDRGLEDVEAVVRSVVRETLAEVPTVAEEERQRLLEHVVGAALEGVRDRWLEVDLAEVDKTLPQLRIAAGDSLRVEDLLDQVHATIFARVSASSYGREWILRDRATGRAFTDIGSPWAEREKGWTRDGRPISAVGITAGSVLAVGLLDGRRRSHRISRR